MIHKEKKEKGEGRKITGTEQIIRK